MPKLCGLELEELGKFKGSLEAILHAIDEKDWERIAPDEIQTDLRPYIEKMEKAGCTSIPHGLFSATEILQYFMDMGLKYDKYLLFVALEKGKIKAAKCILANLANTDDPEIDEIKATMAKASKQSHLWGITPDEWLGYCYATDKDYRQERWHNKHGEHNSNFSSCSLYGFNQQLYQTLLPIMKFACEMEHNQGAELHAYKLAVLFSSIEEVAQYLEQYAKDHPEAKQPIHDACLFNLPNCGVWDIPTWRALILKPCGWQMTKYLSLAPKIEQRIDGKTVPLALIKRQITQSLPTPDIKKIKATTEHRFIWATRNIEDRINSEHKKNPKLTQEQERLIRLELAKKNRKEK